MTDENTPKVIDIFRRKPVEEIAQEEATYNEETRSRMLASIDTIREHVANGSVSSVVIVGQLEQEDGFFHLIGGFETTMQMFATTGFMTWLANRLQNDFDAVESEHDEAHD